MRIKHNILSVFFISIFALLGCQNTEPSQQEKEQMPKTLTGHTWSLQTLTGKDAFLGANNKPLTIEFLDEKLNYRGFGGCNNYSGRYALEDNKIEFGPAMATRKFCEKSMKQETAYFKALSEAATFKIEANTLTISDQLNQVLAIYTTK